MDSTTHPAGTQAPDSATRAAEAKKRQRQILLVSAFTLWVIGWIALLVAAVIVRFHPGPWPFDLQTTVTLQSLHYPPWLLTIIDFPSRFNDIIPAVIAGVLWLAGLLLIAWIFKRRGKSPMLWIVSALFIVFGTLVFADLAINGLISRLVNRPRPSPLLIHVYNPEPVASFPSGHVEHTFVYYGFLLYLSFTKPVREWRYHWLLLPLQIFAALNILMIGYSRVEEGSHWLSDAVAGYLEGAIALVLLILLYRWTLKKLEERRAKRLVGQPAMATQAHQPGGETMRGRSLGAVHTVEEKSLETVQVVEKEVKPFEQLLIKCKEDWIHHLAQALAFSYITAVVSGAVLVVGIVGLIEGKFDTQVPQMLASYFGAGTPSQLISFFDQTSGRALGIFTHSSTIEIFLLLVLAVLLASFFFSLLESCFDVIYHLPPRPFLRRHLVAIVMLFLYLVPFTIGIGVAEAPRLVLSLLHLVQPSDTPGSNLTLSIAGKAVSILIGLILFEFIYVMIPHRHITFRTLGHHIRHSWRGAVIATVATQLFLLVFPLFTLYFLGSYIGQVAFVAILLLYFYMTTLIILFGAEVNAFFAEGIHLPKYDIITQASRDEYR